MSDDQKISKLCRICLNSSVKLFLSLFDKYKEFAINDYILLLTNVEIKREDGFPDKICSSCFMELETAVNFKQKCENSDLFLKTNKDKIIEACTNGNLNDIIIVKKEEPYEAEIKFEEAPDDTYLDEYYAVETLEDVPVDYEREASVDYLTEIPVNYENDVFVDSVKPVKSKGIDLKLECHDCGNLFKSKCKLRVHWKKSHMLSSLICDICKRKFKSYKAYHMHKKRPTKSCKTAGNNLVRIEGEGRSRVFHCKECDYKTSRIKDIDSHIVIHSGDRPFECEICKNRYTQQSSLQSHMEGAHKKYLKEMTCHMCGKQVKGRTRIYRHMLIHTEKKFPCPVCKKPFSKKNLKQHVVRHSGIKSYTCEKCASTFYTLGELCNHRRWVHNKSKNAYKCDLCSYTASRSDRIKIHKKNHTDTNVPCTICGMFFPNVQKMELHHIQHFAEKTYECPYCEKKFFKNHSVGKHVRIKHRRAHQLAREQMNPVQKNVTPETEKTQLACKVEDSETSDLVVKIVAKPELECR